MHRTFAAAASAVFVLAAAQEARAANWVEFYFHQGTGTRFYYDVQSVRRSGGMSQVRWYDNGGGRQRPETIVFSAEINCSARTIRNLSVDRFNSSNGSYIATVDLRNEPSNRPQTINSGTMSGYLAQRVC